MNMASSPTCPFGFSSSASLQGEQSISVVIPAYNYAKYLPRAIESVQCQLSLHDELIVVDDGSTDDTADVVSHYGDSVRYLRQENQGPYAACVNGLSHANNEYLVMFDADDELLPDALSHLRQFLQRKPSARVVLGRYAEVSEDGQTRRVSPKPTLRGQLSNFRNFLNRRLPIVFGAAV